MLYYLKINRLNNDDNRSDGSFSVWNFFLLLSIVIESNSSRATHGRLNEIFKKTVVCVDVFHFQLL